MISKTSDIRCNDAEATRWFQLEVQPHERPLRAYLRRAFPYAMDLDDLVQEAYLRIWQVRAKRHVESPKALLFAIGKNLALDVVRREKVSPMVFVGDLSTLSAFDEQCSVREAVSTREKNDLLAEAIENLPARCREVIRMRKLRALSQRETAVLLKISERTVEVQVSRAVRRCEIFMQERGVCTYD